MTGNSLSSRLAPRRLFRLADSPLQKVEDRLECAVPDEILVTGLAGEPQLLGFRCCVEQCSAKAKRDDPVSLAVKDLDRRLDIADPREGVETVAHERGRRYEGVMVLGDFGDAGEGRFEYQ